MYQNKILSQVPVVHACNPSYSGGRDQEDCSLKSARANSSRDPILKKPFTKRAGGVAQGVGPEFKIGFFAVLGLQKKKKKKIKGFKNHMGQ
jgi:hypothetical protein